MRPLVVDLDGTLIVTDLLYESLIQIFKNNLFTIFKLFFVALEGKAPLKQFIASKVNINPANLPYNSELLKWLQYEYKKGRKLILSTGSDFKNAKKIAEYLGIFHSVIASDGVTNNTGLTKSRTLVSRYGKLGFDYVGNSYDDIFVWEKARFSIIVNASNNLIQKVYKISRVNKIFSRPKPSILIWFSALRIHQWLKNLLLFVPLLAGHVLPSTGSWTILLLAFMSFNICASSVYITNDLFDLESDRQHQRKKMRPFASGKLPVWIGIILAPILIASAILIATFVSIKFLYSLLIYFVITFLYSIILKKLVLIDCLTLAFLYTIRIISGAVVIGDALSFWLLAFSFFIFLSLAFVKRYAEILSENKNNKAQLSGRGYFITDAPLIQTLGITSGYASVIVLALYLNSESVLRLYQSPQLIWLAIPVMLFWVSSIWMYANHDKMHDDPLIFAIKNSTSITTGLIFVAIMVMGTIGID